MLRFFRVIREKLLSQGKVRAYLLYAFGEILLVMIGILLALQVNNWNEDRKSRELEHTMLLEVQTALTEDVEYFNGLTRRMERTQNSAKVFVRIMEGEISVPQDSLINLLDDLMLGYAFAYNSGPYEAIKSAGLDLISNKELRSRLVNVYDFQLPRNRLLLNELVLPELVAGFNLRDEFMQVTPYINQKGEIDYRYSFKSADPFKEPEFLKIFIEFEKASDQLIRRLSTQMPELETLIELIETEVGT